MQILLQLKGAGLVISTRGASGGYQLARAPQDISLGEVMSVIEGPDELRPVACRPIRGCPSVAKCLVRGDPSATRDALPVTFGELLDRARDAESMYYI